MKYAAVALVWIVGSDLVVFWLYDGGRVEAGWNIAKGTFFVMVTAAILYGLARRMQTRIRRVEEARRDELLKTTQHMERVRDLYAVLVRANKATLSATDEATLCGEISTALVSLAGLRFVWFAWADEATLRVNPDVWSGDAPGYLDNFVCSIDPADEHGCGPTGRAIREARIVVSGDMLTDHSVLPWRALVEKYGFRSCACVPIRVSGRRGSISAYAGQPNFFDPEITELMGRLAADLEHGLKLIADRDERARLNTRLRESEERHRALFENDHVAMLLVDPTVGRICDANPAAVRFYGWPKGELLRKSISDINLLSKAEVAENMHRAVSGERRRFLFRHRLADGNIRDVEVFSVPVRLGDRDLLYSIIHDISEECRVTARLRLMQTAMEAAPSGMVISDALGRIEWVNAAFTTMTGYTLENVAGRTHSILKSGRQGPAFYDSLWNTISRGRVWSGDLQNQRHDGAIYWEHMVISPVMTPSGAIEHYVAIKQDISSQKEMELQVARSQRLESIGLLAGGIAHDLNNVLAPILMAMDLFKLRYTEPADQARLEMVRKSAERGAGIVRQVLTFARGVDGERMTLQPQHLIKEVRNLLQETLPRSIDIVLDLEADLPAIIGDPTQLHQVLVNLGVNARDAMPHGGVLTFGAKRECLAGPRVTQSGLTVPAGNYLNLFVRDTGSGISPEVMEHILEPFFTTKARGEGTGLGLSTVLGIVRGHGGGLDISTTLGKGTEFRVLLPVATGQENPRLFADAAAPFEGAGRVILVVDDEEPVLAVTGLALELNGFVHVDAMDGQIALEHFDRDPDRFAAVILDRVMPRIGGDEVAIRIKAIRPNLPIILTSGMLSEDRTGAGDAYRKLGDLVLHKPFSQGDLLGALSRVLK
jgi:PAS domain S-box-containing protein